MKIIAHCGAKKVKEGRPFGAIEMGQGRGGKIMDQGSNNGDNEKQTHIGASIVNLFICFIYYMRSFILRFKYSQVIST